jgi:hypothetical protein
VGEPPGCVPDRHAIELARFYVDRPYHGRGVAHTLMRALLQAASPRSQTVAKSRRRRPSFWESWRRSSLSADWPWPTKCVASAGEAERFHVRGPSRDVEELWVASKAGVADNFCVTYEKITQRSLCFGRATARIFLLECRPMSS